jgi:hypothetical protein
MDECVLTFDPNEIQTPIATGSRPLYTTDAPTVRIRM